MSELSSEASALVGEGRSLLRPTTEDRARVASALARRLGGSVLLVASPGQAARPAAFASKLSSLVVVAGVVGAGATYWLTRAPEPPQAPVAPVRASLAPEGSLSSVAEGPGIAPEAPEPATVPAAAPSPPRKVTPADGLTEEVALLSRATGQLQRGDAVGALQVLEQHRKRFPTGRLLEERLAARIQALCLLGALGEAEVELSRLAGVAPRSPHLARAQRACGR